MNSLHPSLLCLPPASLPSLFSPLPPSLLFPLPPSLFSSPPSPLCLSPPYPFQVVAATITVTLSVPLGVRNNLHHT